MSRQCILKLSPGWQPAASNRFQLRPCRFGKKTAAAAAVFGDVVINRCQQVFRQGGIETPGAAGNARLVDVKQHPHPVVIVVGQVAQILDARRLWQFTVHALQMYLYRLLHHRRQVFRFIGSRKTAGKIGQHHAVGMGLVANRPGQKWLSACRRGNLYVDGGR